MLHGAPLSPTSVSGGMRRFVMSLPTRTKPVSAPSRLCSARRSTSSQSVLPLRARCRPCRRRPAPRCTALRSCAPCCGSAAGLCSSSCGRSPFTSSRRQPVHCVKAALTHSMRSSASVISTSAAVRCAAWARRCASAPCRASCSACSATARAVGSTTASATTPSSTTSAAMPQCGSSHSVSVPCKATASMSTKKARYIDIRTRCDGPRSPACGRNGAQRDRRGREAATVVG